MEPGSVRFATPVCDTAHERSVQVPSTFSFLGIRNESAGSVHGLHTPRFTMDESQMPLGAAQAPSHLYVLHRCMGWEYSNGWDWS